MSKNIPLPRGHLQRRSRIISPRREGAVSVLTPQVGAGDEGPRLWTSVQMDNCSRWRGLWVRSEDVLTTAALCGTSLLLASSYGHTLSLGLTCRINQDNLHIAALMKQILKRLGVRAAGEAVSICGMPDVCRLYVPKIARMQAQGLYRPLKAALTVYLIWRLWLGDTDILSVIINQSVYIVISCSLHALQESVRDRQKRLTLFSDLLPCESAFQGVEGCVSVCDATYDLTDHLYCAVQSFHSRFFY